MFIYLKMIKDFVYFQHSDATFVQLCFSLFALVWERSIFWKVQTKKKLSIFFSFSVSVAFLHCSRVRC